MHIDATHGTNNAKFLLTTIIVMDRHMNGVPVAFFVHSRGTTRIVRDCLTALLKAAREVQPDFEFGSVGCDAAMEEITAIRETMSGVPIFLCAWHVKRAWLSNLTSTVADADKRTEIWRALDELMRLNVQLPTSHSKEDLAKLCTDVLERFYSEFSEQAAFITYFKKEWAGKVEVWAQL
ncbi:g11415 [Coccomyxa elongata]